MRIIEDLAQMKAEAAELAAKRTEAGLVATMGALHRGHASLIERAAAENEVTVVSAFVNPGVLDSQDEYDAYPRTADEDADAAEAAGADILFRPPLEAMFGPRLKTSVLVHGLTSGLCGMARGQGHFRAAATVAAKLFNIIRPARAYYGQKDAQEALVIQRMALDLEFPVSIVLCPVIRDDDGLPLSTRNRSLSPEQRERAAGLRRALLLGRRMIQEGERSAMTVSNAMAEAVLADAETELEYIDVVSPDTLDGVDSVDDLVLMAGSVCVGGVRILDNILVGPDGPWSD